MKRIIEFFEDGTGRLSMSRLLCFLSFFPSAFVMYHFGKEVLAIFLSAYGPGMYTAGKGMDAMENIFKKPGVEDDNSQGSM